MPGAMPQDHARSLREQKPMSRRTKFWLAGVAALVIVGFGVAILLTTGGKTGKGCISTYLPGVIGAQTFDACGQEAKQACAGVSGQKRQYGTVGVLIVEKACRKAGLAVG
jgi:hypothetical protein